LLTVNCQLLTVNCQPSTIISECNRNWYHGSRRSTRHSSWLRGESIS